MNKKRIMFLVLFFLSLISYTSSVSAGPSLCCSMHDNAIEDVFIQFAGSLTALFFIYIFLKSMLVIYAKKEERENNKKNNDNNFN